MAPKFGTSGLRGLVVELTDTLVADYTYAFLATCPQGATMCLGRDLRPSSAGLAAVVRETARASGMDVVDCGALPTPALALEAGARGAGAVMVTGSHIPADRNGLKFYTPAGEIEKAHEAAIRAAVETEAAIRAAVETEAAIRAAVETEAAIRAAGDTGARPVAEPPRTGTLAEVSDAGALSEAPGAGAAWVARIVRAFGADALVGLRIGVYQHSSVARDLLVSAVAEMGGTPVVLARSESFIPVDTEALDPQTGAMLAGWVAAHRLDAVISTDGDADRPMLADGSGRVIPGDILGALTAQALGARVVVTPVSANSMIETLPGIERVIRTRIGSPYVIAGMQDAQTARVAPGAAARTEGASGSMLDSVPVVGFEPNGGFLLGFAAQGPAGPLAPLMTRDCLLPLIAPLAAARGAGGGLADLVAALPARFTAADRLQGIDAAVSGAFIATLEGDPAARAAFFDGMGAEAGLDLTDGLRVRFVDGAVVHLRASGNAPELRCYAEATSAEHAATLVARHLARLKQALPAV